MSKVKAKPTFKRVAGDAFKRSLSGLAQSGVPAAFQQGVPSFYQQRQNPLFAMQTNRLVRGVTNFAQEVVKFVKDFDKFSKELEEFSQDVTRNAQDHADSINELYELRWDDLRFPAQGINPAGSTAPPGVNTTDGLLDFDASGTELIGGCAQLPHSWAETTPIRPHIHLLYRNAAAGDSVWKFEYQIANVNGNFAGSYTSETKTHTGPASAVKHEILAFSEIAMTDYKDSCVMLWRISRIGGNVSDTFAHDVGLIEFDIHYQSDGRGSAQEYPS